MITVDSKCLCLTAEQMKGNIRNFIQLSESLCEHISRLEGYSNMDKEIRQLQRLWHVMQEEVLQYRQFAFLLESIVLSYEKNERKIQDRYEEGELLRFRPDAGMQRVPVMDGINVDIVLE